MSQKVLVEKGVPLPFRGTNVLRYPYDTMEVGDSFALPAGRYAAVSNTAGSYGKKHGRTFAIRKRVEEGAHVVRCWRTS